MSATPNFGRGPAGAFAAAVRSTLPRIDYQAKYSARVVKFGSGLVDVVPDDPDLPSMPGLQVMHGIPGLTIGGLAEGTTILVGWSEGDPGRPYAALWGGGEHVTAATWAADMLTLGGDAGAEPPLKATSYRGAEDQLFNAFVVAITAALTPHGLVSAIGALNAARAAFAAGAPTFPSTNVQVK